MNGGVCGNTGCKCVGGWQGRRCTEGQLKLSVHNAPIQYSCVAKSLPGSMVLLALGNIKYGMRVYLLWPVKIM